MAQDSNFWLFVRENVIGRDVEIPTPFGHRKITYADYIASGQGVAFIERYMEHILRLYGNTHTEDDATGALTTERLHQAETIIKRTFNAGEHYRIIEAEYGTTGAVHRLQQILGIYIPPVAKDRFLSLFRSYFSGAELSRFESFLVKNRPVIFVGPYEHHSNEVSWRECFCEVVETELTENGLFSLQDLEKKVSSADYRNRMRIGAFSAASNVTGVVTPIYEVARILHRYDALAFFDFAAIAPYAEVNVCRDSECYFDGIYFSPHKFLGGPGSAGILIIHERIYRRDLPPTVGAGGTVDFVNFDEQEYNPDIEIREKPGTPGILQTMRAALALQLKEKIDLGKIESREKEMISKALARCKQTSEIEIMGNADAENRIPILSFNIRTLKGYLHPRFVTALLNDLFGIQSRAGCSCAAPYGHRMLQIDHEKSLAFKKAIICGQTGVKPGWTRVSFHFLMTDEGMNFICDAIEFVAQNGKYFLPLYDFDLCTGKWKHKSFTPLIARFGLDEALELAANVEEVNQETKPLKYLYLQYMKDAHEQVEKLKKTFRETELKTTDKDLIPFLYA
jgi:selenocysteine lyase/cysteine desulfurase